MRYRKNNNKIYKKRMQRGFDWCSFECRCEWAFINRLSRRLLMSKRCQFFEIHSDFKFWRTIRKRGSENKLRLRLYRKLAEYKIIFCKTHRTAFRNRSRCMRILYSPILNFRKFLPLFIERQTIPQCSVLPIIREIRFDFILCGWNIGLKQIKS